MYKGRSLVKLMMIVASDDYIIDIIGPLSYLADSRNNNAVISNKL